MKHIHFVIFKKGFGEPVVLFKNDQTKLCHCCITRHCICRQAALERQDLSCTYLAHHELESVLIIIITIVIIIIIIIILLIVIIVHITVSAPRVRSHQCSLPWTSTMFS